LHWQGVDPAEFIRRFGDRIYHVHVKDVAISLNGRSGLLGSYLPYDDPRRGWQPRSPGRGGLGWESIIRGLDAVGYRRPLAGGGGRRGASSSSASTSTPRRAATTRRFAEALAPGRPVAMLSADPVGTKERSWTPPIRGTSS